jgi:hypothetical protein
MKKRVLKLMRRKLVFSEHAIERILHPSRRLSRDEVREAIEKGDIIEEQRPDVIVIQSWRPNICVVVGICEDYLVVITAWRGKR